MTLLALTFVAALLSFAALWLVSLKKADTSVVDFWWGPGFVVIGWLAFALADLRHREGLLLILLPLTLWGVRLGWYIASRHRGEEDPRYRAMRDAAGKGWPFRSLYIVFGLQAVIQWMASSPVLTVALAAPAALTPVTITLISLGGLLFGAGFALEVVADRAVSRFRAQPENRGKLLMTGLHARIRHPNYLGEIILQIGFALIALGVTLHPAALIGPAMMIGLIVKLSGVPMLDTELRKRPGYEAWVKSSGALWPRRR